MACRDIVAILGLLLCVIPLQGVTPANLGAVDLYVAEIVSADS